MNVKEYFVGLYPEDVVRIDTWKENGQVFSRAEYIREVVSQAVAERMVELGGTVEERKTLLLRRLEATVSELVRLEREAA